MRHRFAATPNIVDIDDSLEAAQPRWLIAIDRARAARLQVDQTSIAQAISTALSGSDASFLHNRKPNSPSPAPATAARREK